MIVNNWSEADVTFVIPCLNEELVLYEFLSECQNVFQNDFNRWIILLCDNNSIDSSREIANNFNVKTIINMVEGYGATVNFGIMMAETKYIVISDADGTYRPIDAIKLYNLTKEIDIDLCLGSRMKGEMESYSMKPLHRYFGTPFLNLLIMLVTGRWFSDITTGMRCIKKSSYIAWAPRDEGMVFSCTAILMALRHSAKIVESPINFRKCSSDSRVPHLKTFRDGIRYFIAIIAHPFS